MSRLNVDLFSSDNPEFESRKIGILSYDREANRLDMIGDEKQLMMDIIQFPEVPPPDLEFEDNPEFFLSQLAQTYRSVALQASEPYESEEKPRL